VLDKSGQLIPKLTISQARGRSADGTISGGRIPTVQGCSDVVEAGVAAVVVISGTVPHAVLIEWVTQHGAGTLSAED
jgi:acetylglutamate kinase